MATLNDIKSELESFGLTNKEFVGKKKAELEIMLADCESDLNDTVPEAPEDNAEEWKSEDVESPMSPSDLGWTQFVLDWLDETEKYDGKYPKVDGLRRFAHYYYEIVSSTTDIVCSPNVISGDIAVIRHRVEFRNGNYSDGVADASPNNTDFPFSKYLIACAETRAEGRALRRALKIQVVTAEELQHGDAALEPELDSEGVTSSQVNFLTNMAINSDRGCDVNIEKLVKYLFGKHYTDIKQLSRSQAGLLNQTLSGYQSEANTIPDTVKGYNPDWSTNFYKEQNKGG